MRHKVSELEGVFLDHAVALAEQLRYKSEGRGLSIERGRDVDGSPCIATGTPFGMGIFRPSTKWEFAWPIIEREKLSIVAYDGPPWGCHYGVSHYIDTDVYEADGTGKTPLIAAMRAYVARTFGDEVEIPE